METEADFNRSEKVYLLVLRACRRILKDYQDKKIRIEQAHYRLELIENHAYNADPDAEPDGDITFTVATTREKILDEHENQRRHAH